MRGIVIFLSKCLEVKKNTLNFASLLRRTRAFSSAGSEHLPYKQRVGGSNPSTPTTKLSTAESFFYTLPQRPPSRSVRPELRKSTNMNVGTWCQLYMCYAHDY